METNIIELKEKILEIVAKGIDLKNELTDPKAWDSVLEVNQNLNEMSAFILYVIVETEAMVNDLNEDLEDIKSPDKVRALIQALDDAIVLPWYAEAFDDIVITIAVNKGVEYLNKRFGKVWNLDEVRDYLAKLRESFEAGKSDADSEK